MGISYQPSLDCHVLMDWRNGVLDIVALTSEEVEMMMGWTRQIGGGAIQFMATRECTHTLLRFGMSYCTTAIQHALAIPVSLISTPDKLYKQLINHGGVVLI